MNEYCKSPLNYIGGKYKLLPKMIPFFPKRVNTMYDLFAGGCDVCANISANTIYANDINYFVVDIFKAFQKEPVDTLIKRIDDIIEEWGLSKNNEDGFLRLRRHYNSLPEKERDPLELYALVCHSFNYQFRFNNNKEFNNPFGRNRSSFNPKMRDNLIVFHDRIKNVHFSSVNFHDLDLGFLEDGDFLYADPPYLITTGSYNDGKRGFEGWSEKDDLDLFSLLDELDSKGVNFALSNVTIHKGKKNESLIKWKKRYHTHKLSYNYNNCNYHAQNKKHDTEEVLITNY